MSIKKKAPSYSEYEAALAAYKAKAKETQSAGDKLAAITWDKGAPPAAQAQALTAAAAALPGVQALIDENAAAAARYDAARITTAAELRAAIA